MKEDPGPSQQNKLSAPREPAGEFAKTIPPAQAEWSWMLLLRLLLVLDAAVLLALGAAFILAPGQVLTAFHFQDLPQGVSYIVGLWGCVLLTMAFGYAVAATNPIRHLVWVQVGIARGVLECVLGLVYVFRGVVTWPQSMFGIAVAALMSIAYLALYPRKRRDVRPVGHRTE